MAEIELMLISAIYGFVLATIFLVAYNLGGTLYDDLYAERPDLVITLLISTLIIVVTYLHERVAPKEVGRLVKWKHTRLDLLLYASVGVYLAMSLALTFGLKVRIQNINPYWPLAIYALFNLALASATIRSIEETREVRTEALSFLPDDEVSDLTHDCLHAASHAKRFASVVESESKRGAIVFGVDGPWGVGKSSFVNFAQGEWEKVSGIITLRFEPIKYLGENDLVKGLIQELSGRIGEDHFAPELRPLASKYSRMIKATPGFSLPGLSLSFNDNYSTIDEIIFDVNEVLRRYQRRAIIVIDDLDRLEIEVINRVLFMIKRSSSASNVSFVLVYDMERIVSRSRDDSFPEYLEKFINAKTFLFADLKDLADYLRGKWVRGIPSEYLASSSKVLGLQSILTDLADLIGGERGGHYIEVVGNIRKIKRLINAMLLMGMEQVELGQTDFDRRDLLNLIILYTNFPGVFRDIYAHEGEGRTGYFSVQSKAGEGYKNHDEFAQYLSGLDAGPKYFVGQLFCAEEIGINKGGVFERQLNSLACFNSRGRRNLAKYLELIVRFVAPDPLSTSIAYETILEKISSGKGFKSAIEGSVFEGNYSAQARLLSTFAAAAGRFEASSKREVALYLIENLPLFDCIEKGGPSERSVAVKSLAYIVNSMYPGLDPNIQGFDSSANELKSFIVGNGDGNSVAEKLSVDTRGVQGIHDLVEFRIHCCADTVGPFRNIYSALFAEFRWLYVKWGGDRQMKDNQMVIDGLRHMSQAAFGAFKRRYVDERINVFIDSWHNISSTPFNEASRVHCQDLGYLLSQLSSVEAPKGYGVGCGYYDELGDDDRAGIGKIMNRYVFEVCFDPALKENALAFADYCLSSFSIVYGQREAFAPTKKSLERGLDGGMFKEFWVNSRDTIISMNLDEMEREVISASYSASYAHDLRGVWNVLDSAYLDS